MCTRMCCVGACILLSQAALTTWGLTLCSTAVAYGSSAAAAAAAAAVGGREAWCSAWCGRVHMCPWRTCCMPCSPAQQAQHTFATQADLPQSEASSSTAAAAAERGIQCSMQAAAAPCARAGLSGDGLLRWPVYLHLLQQAQHSTTRLDAPPASCPTSTGAVYTMQMCSHALRLHLLSQQRADHWI